LEELGRNVDIPAVDALATVGRQASVPDDVDDGHHGVAVLMHEREVRLDVRAKRARPGRSGKDARDYVTPTGLDDLDHDLPDEVVLAGKVVADHALADADPLGDASEGCLRETNLGDRVDRGGNDLLAPSVLDERPLLRSRRRLGHDQNLGWLTI
jgi:hypothetical protein